MIAISSVIREESKKQIPATRTKIVTTALLPLLLLLLALPTVVHAQFTFTTNNGAITITAWTGPANGTHAVAIPATINGFPVTSIGNLAFFCTFMTNVTMPNSITNIGDLAFRQGQLQSVTIPDSVLSIGASAFQSCPNLTNATLGTNVISIGISAFANCYVLPSITIPSSVSSIGTNAFYYSTRLTEITVDPQNTNYSSVDGVLFNKSQTTLLQFPAGKAGSYTVPNGVTNIGDHAFHYCTNLTSITISDSVTSIGSYGFAECHSLTNAATGNGVSNIGSNAFYACVSLKAVTLANSVTSIGSWAFANCVGLASVSLANRVANIGAYAFYYCIGLTSVTIPSSVTNIDNKAFASCPPLMGAYFQGNAPSAISTVFQYDNMATVYYLPWTTGWPAPGELLLAGNHKLGRDVWRAPDRAVAAASAERRR